MTSDHYAFVHNKHFLKNSYWFFFFFSLRGRNNQVIEELYKNTLICLNSHFAPVKHSAYSST